jgi:putative ATP-dependent endonuclease of OLD family
MRLRRVSITRYRGIEWIEIIPGPRNVILGPQNSGKSTVLEALDLLLHHGFGRPRQPPTEIDYFQRAVEDGFEIEAVIGDLTNAFRAEVAPHLEGWKSDPGEVVPDTDGDDIEDVVRVRVRGTHELTLVHEFAKPEAEGEFFNPARRIQVGWVFDGRTRDPLRQLAFYQGGLLERLFGEVDLDPAVGALRDALRHGAEQVNTDANVAGVLDELAEDLRELGLLGAEDKPSFEAGSVSARELLQSLRLALPSQGEPIPLMRQGRGAQRLVLVSILLRVARTGAEAPGLIGGFEEPEEALEPLRQTQLSGMLCALSDEGGQVFVVTHSPEIARRFEIDDFLLLAENAAGAGARQLRTELSAAVRQTYERWLDGGVVRGLFSRVPVLVEGPGDRAVFETFWRARADGGVLSPPAELGLEIVNCEGISHMPMQAAVLNQAGKHVVIWVDRDTPEAEGLLERLKSEGNSGLVTTHSTKEGQRNLEGALAQACSMEGLVLALTAIAEDRGYDWEAQRDDLVSRATGIDAELREKLKGAGDLSSFLQLLEEADARDLIAAALSARGVAPFDLKGGRQARIFALAIVSHEGVPASFATLLQEIERWISDGCPGGIEVEMSGG